VAWASAGAALVVVLAGACTPASTPDSLPGDPQLRELALLLRSESDGETGDSAGTAAGAETKQRFLELLSPVEAGLPGYLLNLESMRFDGVLSFELTLRSPGDEPVLGLHFFYRPGRSESLRRTYGDHEVAGFPAMATAQEQIFLLAGNVEVRVFQRAAEFRNDQRLLEVVSLLPLEALAEL
jgi:hypothetical protein